jgi:DNA modification methylase
MQLIAISALKSNTRNTRTHSKKQIRQIAGSITAFGFLVPILIDDDNVIIAGHGRYSAAVLLGLQEVPVIRVVGLSEAKRRAFALADNKIAQNAGWDREQLAIEIPELTDLLIAEGLDISILGFEPAEIDQLQTDFEAEASDPQDSIEPNWFEMAAVSKPGDLWQLGNHRLMCADARCGDDVCALMAGCRADMGFLDPPYNLSIAGVVGRGKTKHNEFAMASGEMSSPDFVRFLGTVLDAAAAASRDGAVHFVCMDWRHIGELLEAAKSIYGATLNLVVWAKTNAGQGSFYRSAHELIGVFRVGESAHLNNIELGRHGRSRSNVWHYAGVNAFRAGRMDELRSHPTAKPVALVADAIKDCTRRGDIVLDTFAGSGTTIMAAERWDAMLARSNSILISSMPPFAAGRPSPAGMPSMCRAGSASTRLPRPIQRRRAKRAFEQSEEPSHDQQIWQSQISVRFRKFTRLRIVLCGRLWQAATTQPVQARRIRKSQGPAHGASQLGNEAAGRVEPKDHDS